ncbi:MAG: TonB-dependent receptor [Bacteroidales bacterium]
MINRFRILRFGLIFFCLLIVKIGYSKVIPIQGVVRDAVTKIPIKSALIYLDATQYETSTNEKGEFLLNISDTLLGEKVILICHKMKYYDISKTILIKNQNVYNFDLDKESNIKGVVVSSKRMETKDNGIKMEIRDLPFKSVDLSVASAIRGNEGAQVDDRGEGVIVRGGIGSETGFVFDGINIVDFFSNSPDNESQSSRFSTKVFKNINYSAGGFSSEYGQYMSSIISMESQDMPVPPLNVEITLSSMNQGFSILKSFKNKYAFEIGSYYSDMSLSNKLFYNKKAFSKFDTAPRDFTSYFRHITLLNKYTALKFYSDFSSSNYRVSYPVVLEGQMNSISNSTRNNSTFSIVSLKHDKGNNKVLFSNAIQYLENRVSSPNGYNESTLQAQSHLDWQHFANKTNSILGYDVVYNKSNLPFDSTTENIYYATFANSSIALRNNLSFSAGLRYEYNRINSEGRLLPRLHVLYAKNHHSLKYDIGLYSQLPLPYFLSRDKNLKSEKSFQNVLTYEYKDIKNKNLHINLAAYYKKYNDLVLYDDSGLNNGGHGYAGGFDIYAAYYDVFGGMLTSSYSYIDSKRLFRDYPRLVQPSFVASNNVRLNYLKYSNKISTFFNVQYSYASGRPYSIPSESIDDFMSNRLKDYNNLTLTIAHLTRVAKTQTVIALSFINVLNTQHIQGYTYLPNSEAVPIYPMFNRMVYLGVTFNFNHKSKKEIERELFKTK